MERIELIHVNKKLGGKEVLKGVDLTLEEGKLYGIIGENGSGKTMLLRLLAGLIHPDDGEVHYGGKKVKKLTQVVNIGLSIENIGLYDDMTVYQNMKYYAKLSGGCDKRKIEETLQRMGLTDRKNMRFAKLSLGLKQKAVLAQAILSSRIFCCLMNQQMVWIRMRRMRSKRWFWKKFKEAVRLWWSVMIILLWSRR